MTTFLSAFVFLPKIANEFVDLDTLSLARFLTPNLLPYLVAGFAVPPDNMKLHPRFQAIKSKSSLQATIGLLW
ncbi:hypothetical protein M514_26927 [Trichuris suis]|uniref:Uncharacterized protein n=1 Tax=Trichuris suis TaxID=68888 RepID=A0A085MUH0_9BILA|nr:hypothetical protein M514_26927 [Trichuris suis]